MKVVIYVQMVKEYYLVEELVLMDLQPLSVVLALIAWHFYRQISHAITHVL